MADKKDTSPASAEPPAEQAVTTPVAPAAGAATPAKKNWTRFLTPALALVAALIVGGVAGVLIGQSTASASNASSVRPGAGTGQGGEGGFGGFGNRQGTGTGTGTGTAGGARGGFTAGTITSIDGGTITLKLTDGSTVKVSTSDSTTVTKSSTAKVSDLATGETITVTGQADSSGDVTATRIAEGDVALGGFGGGARPSGAPTP
jgi:hypothetical protein